MKKEIQLLLLLFLLIGFTNCKRHDESRLIYNKKYIKEIKQSREKLVQYITRNSIPALGISVFKDGELVYSEGIGLASQDLSVRANRYTKYRIGPVSEVFTATIYHKMVEEGKLNPDSTIGFYLPDYPKTLKDAPIKYLANHVSGLRDFAFKEKTESEKAISIQKGLNMIKNDSLLFKPGEYLEESRFNYIVLGAIMEKVSGDKFDKLLKKYVTDTLKFNHTSPDYILTSVKDRPDFYDKNMFSQAINAATINMQWRWPSDGLLASTEDLVKLGRLYLDTDYFNSDTKEKLFEPFTLDGNRKTNFSDGWYISQDRNRNKVCGKEGTVIGGSSTLLVYPDAKMVIAIATNITKGLNNTPAFIIGEIFLDQYKENTHQHHHIVKEKEKENKN
jgi:CubicO group peptidase (beta-lactamase class C family)